MATGEMAPHARFAFLVAGLCACVLASLSVAQDVTGAPPAWRPDPERPPLVPELVIQAGHPADLTALAVSPDGTLVATAAELGPILLWQTATARELRRFDGGQGTVRWLCFVADGSELLACTEGGHLRRIRVADGSIVHEALLRVRAFKVLRFEAFELSADESRLLTHSRQGAAVFDLRAELRGRHLVAERSFEGERYRSVAFGSDEGVLATAVGGGQVVVSDLEEGRELGRFALGERPRLVEGGTVLVLGDADRTPDILRGFDLASGAPLWGLSRTGRSSLAFRALEQGRLLATEPEDVYLFDPLQDRPLWRAEVRSLDVRYPPLALRGALSSAGNVALTQHEDRITRLWRLTDGAPAGLLAGSCALVSGVWFDVESDTLVVGEGEHAVQWSLEEGAPLRRLETGGTPRWATPMAAGGGCLVSTLGGRAKWWSLREGGEGSGFSDPSLSSARVLCVDEQGRQALFVRADELVLYDLQQDATRWTLAFPAQEDLAPEAQAATFSAEGSRLVVGGSGFQGDAFGLLAPTREGRDVAPGWLLELDVATGAPVRVIDQAAAVGDLAFHPNGSEVFVAYLDTPLGRNGSGGSWDLDTGAAVFATGKWESHFSCVDVAPDGSLYAFGMDNGKVVFFDEATRTRTTLAGTHDAPVKSLAFLPDGRHVVTASDDHTVRIWDVAEAEERLRLLSFQDGTWAVLDDEGRFDGSNAGAVDGLHWVVGNEAIELSQLKLRYWEPGLLAKHMGNNPEPLSDVRGVRQAGVRLPPRVELVQNPSARDPILRFVLHDRGGGIGPTAVRVNGKQVTADARGNRDPNVGTLEVTLSLADAQAFIPDAENDVEILPFDARSILSARGFQTHIRPREAVAAGRPKLFAVVAGVSDYRGERLDLNFASRDAEVVAATLKTAAARLLGGSDRVQVTCLSDAGSPATRSNLEAALDGLEDARWFDLVVVYLAGHGVTFRDPSAGDRAPGSGGDYFFLTKDAADDDLSDPLVRAQAGFSSHELEERLAGIAARKQVVILDTCFAGRLLEDLTAKRDVPASQKRALDRLRDQTGTFLLAGSASDAVSFEASPFGHGLLTYSLLRTMKEALRPGVDGAGNIDVMGLFSSAQAQVPELARDIGGIQRPQVAMPRLGESFLLGRLDAKDRAAIPLLDTVPTLVVGSFELEDEPSDPLELRRAVRTALTERAQDPKSARSGARPTFLLTDSEAGSPSTWRLAGRYQGDGKSVRLRLFLYEGEVLLAEDLLEGEVDSPATLMDLVLEAVSSRLP